MKIETSLAPVLHGAASDRPDEADTIFAAESVAAALGRLGYDAEILALGLDLSRLASLRNRAPSVIVNLVDALDGDCKLAPMVPLALEHHGLKFTGGGSAPWLATLSKTQSKRALRAAGLPTPDWWSASQAPQAKGRVIVKADIEHGSLGMDAGSVLNAAQAAEEIAARAARFGTPFFAESFIEGREFNLSLLATESGLRVLPIAEIDFVSFDAGQPRIVGYDAKWTPDSAVYRGTPRRFELELADAALAAQLSDLARSCWDLFELRGYARVDFRVDETGAPFILEVNVNPALSPDAGFAAAALEAGLDYDALIGAILTAA
jgi:D-alanine-D-alanine ligase